MDFNFSGLLGGIGNFARNNAADLIKAGINIYGARQAGQAAQAAGTAAATAPAYAPQQIFSPFGNVVSQGGQTQFQAPADPYSVLPPELRTSGTEYADYLGGQADVYGGLGAGFLGALGSFDPKAAAQERYGQLSELAMPEERRQFFNLEDRLFQQGRLGTTGGGTQLEAFGGASERADLERRLAAYDFAGREQQRLAGLGTGFAGAGAQALGGRMGVAGNLLQASQSMFGPLQQLGQFAIGAGGRMGTGGYEPAYRGSMQQSNLIGGALEPIVGGLFDRFGRWLGGSSSGAADASAYSQ